MTYRQLTYSLFFAITATLFVSTNEAAAFPKIPAKKAGKHDWLVKHPTILKLLKLTNEERARYGMPKLKLETKICLEAQKHAVWMSQTGYFMHSNLPWPEIIHSGPTSPEGAIQGWSYSPAHHGIMLMSATKVGFGYMQKNGFTYWVGVFE